MLQAQLLQGLDRWLTQCTHAAFDEAVPLTVVRGRDSRVVMNHHARAVARMPNGEALSVPGKRRCKWHGGCSTSNWPVAGRPVPLSR